MKKRVNLYTDLPVEQLSNDQRINFLKLARMELQKQVLDEGLYADWSSVTSNIEHAAIGHGPTRCWMEVDVRQPAGIDS